MNELEEKVAMLEELVQEFLKRIETVETAMPDFLRTFLEQYKQTLENIAKRIEISNKRYDDAKIQQQIDELRKLVSAVPKVVDVKNHHHFEAWSKNLIIGLASCFIITSLSVGAALHLYSENGRLSENDVKFRMVRQTHPELSHSIDTLYHRDPEQMEARTRELEARQRAIMSAEAEAREIDGKAKKVKKRIDKLKE